MFSAYIWIDGDAFDPVAFHRLLPKEIAGTIEKRKKIVNGSVIKCSSYWKSDLLVATDSLSESLLESFLLRYAEVVLRARQLGAMRIILEIVNEYSEDQGAQGLFLSRSLIQLLTKMTVDLDIDFARSLA